MKKLYSVKEMAAEVKVPYWRFYYLVLTKRVPRPERDRGSGVRRYYGEEDLAKIRELVREE